MSLAQPSQPTRSQSTTSLARFHNGSYPAAGGPGEDDGTHDPKLDFCNAFWGADGRGYDVIMARLRGAGRTVDELRAFWKERAAIEDEYAKRLVKLSKATLGKDEIGDVAASLQNVLEETAQQGQYHASLSQEIRANVEQPTIKVAERLTALKKGPQAQIEKAWRNKGLQEGHVLKAREKYESDCLKLNSYHANQALTQGKEADKLQSKLERVRQTIGQNEQDFRQFVRVLESTQQKWEGEWKGFCDTVQDEEDERLAAIKDIIWAFANAVSQVCVEDDSSCERIRERLEQFEPQNDQIAFVRGWGTGDAIPDPPKFINYSAGEYPTAPTSHIAHFRRDASRPIPAVSNYAADEVIEPALQASSLPQPGPNGTGSGSGLENGMRGVSLRDDPPAQSTHQQQSQAPPPVEKSNVPFGGVALPGMSNRSASPAPPSAVPTSPAPATSDSLPKRLSSMGPPPVPPTMSMPEPRVPSRQGQNQDDDQDPMARALADLRRDPPPPASVRRNASSQRRPESAYSNRGQNNASPAPGSAAPGQGHRASYQAPSGPGGGSEFTLSPPAPGHTAAALQRSMDDFHRRSGPGAGAGATGSGDKRGSVSYNSYGDDVVGAHPASRPASPAPSASAARAPSPAMMQPFSQPATHIADEVLSQYHQAFPGERNERAQARSRAGSVASHRSGGSFVPPPLAQMQGNDAPAPREGFVGIGAGGRSASPAPPPLGAFASPVPSPVAPHGNLGPQNLGIKLDAAGGVAQDSMAEAYRRQYQEQQGQGPGQGQGQGGRPGSYIGPSSQAPPQQTQPQQQQQQQRGSYYGGQGQQYSASAAGHGAKSPAPLGQPDRPTSAYGAPQGYTSPTSYAPPTAFAPSPMPQHQPPPAQQAQGPAQGQGYGSHRSQSSYGGGGGYSNAAAPPTGYGQSVPPPSQQPQGYGGYGQQHPQPPPQQQQQNGYGGGGGGGGGGGYQRSASPAPPHAYQQQQQAGYGRGPSPSPAHQPPQNQGYRAPSPAPASAQQYRAPSPSGFGYQGQPQRPPSNLGQSQGYGGGGAPGGYQGQPPQQQHDQRGGRSPSPQPGVAPVNAAPTGQWSTTGLPVLFYVKALYDYQATSGAEFDFQAGDIIAVTATPEDGWWSGELLDEARRLPGRTDFPSNFVCLF